MEEDIEEIIKEIIAEAGVIIEPYKTGKRWDRIVPMKVLLIAELNVGNGTMYDIVSFRLRDRFFLGIERIGCYSFVMSNLISRDYAAEKLNLAGDAGNIADWINTQLDHEAEEFGRYDEQFCINRSEYKIAKGLQQRLPPEN